MEGLYRLRSRIPKEEEDVLKGPTFPNPPPKEQPSHLTPSEWFASLRKEPTTKTSPLAGAVGLLGGILRGDSEESPASNLASSIVKSGGTSSSEISPGEMNTLDKWGEIYPGKMDTLDKEVAPGKMISLASTGAETADTAEMKNPYQMWGQTLNFGKGFKVPMDQAVTLAGMLAASIAPKEWSGRMGAGLAQLAQAGSAARIEWIKEQQKERRLVAQEKRKEGEVTGHIVADPQSSTGFSYVGKQGQIVSKGAPAPEKTEAQIVAEGGPKAQKLIQYHKEINAPHPSVIELRQAEIEAHKAARKIHEKELDLVPEKYKMAQKEHELRTLEIKKQMEYIDLQNSEIKLRKQLLTEGKDKESVRAALEIDKQYVVSRNTWEKLHALRPKTDDTQMFQSVKELATMTYEHIYGMKTYTTNPQAAERSVRSWFSVAGGEFEKPPLQEYAGLLGISGRVMGKQSQASLNQQAYRRYYVKTASSMLKEAGTPASSDLYPQLVDWIRKAGYSKQEALTTLNSLGLTPEQQIDIINKANTRFGIGVK